MQIPTEIKITVFADAEYRYTVTTGTLLNITYEDDIADKPTIIAFGSKEQMKAVANAMLKAVEYS